MPLKATSVRLDSDTLEQIGQMAEAMDRPRAWLMAQAIKQYVQRERMIQDEIKEGIQAAEAGRLVNHSALKAKWVAKRANPVD